MRPSHCCRLVPGLWAEEFLSKHWGLAFVVKLRNPVLSMPSHCMFHLLARKAPSKVVAYLIGEKKGQATALQ